MRTQADEDPQFVRDVMFAERDEDFASGGCDPSPGRRAPGDASIHVSARNDAAAITHQALDLVDLVLLFAMALVLRADAPRLTLWTQTTLARVAAAVPPSAPWLTNAIVVAQGAPAMVPLALAALIVAGLSVHVTRRRGPLSARHPNWSRLSGNAPRMRGGLTVEQTHRR